MRYYLTLWQVFLMTLLTLTKGLKCSRIIVLKKFALASFTEAHAHIIHDKFSEDEIPFIHDKCIRNGLEYVICNGLDPVSNRKVLDLHLRYQMFIPALGIYPLDAACNIIQKSSWPHPFPPPDAFNVDSEIDFIDEMARNKVYWILKGVGLYIDVS